MNSKNMTNEIVDKLFKMNMCKASFLPLPFINIKKKHYESECVIFLFNFFTTTCTSDTLIVATVFVISTFCVHCLA